VTRILIVDARFYEEIADELVAGAVGEIERRGATYEVVTVPGALEAPQAIAIALDAGAAFDGAVALGCVIRGETSHYDIVAEQSARAVMDLAVARGFPVGNGILTVDTRDQALARAGRAGRNKGGAAAAACLDLIELKRRFAQGSDG
jgi:6,7-dimethyl-8-ribityllumazine synthase